MFVRKLMACFAQKESTKLLLSRLLAATAILYFIFGIYFLLFKDGRWPNNIQGLLSPDFTNEVLPIDFKLRRVEAKYFVERINPYDIFDIKSVSSKSLAYREKLAALVQKTGIPITITAYPLWSFPLFTILFTPFLDCILSRFIFALINISALIYIYRYIYKYSSSFLSSADSHLIARSCMALNGWYITLHNGQISTLLSAAVLMALPKPGSSFTRQIVGNILLSLKFTFGTYPLLVFFPASKKRMFVSAGLVVLMWLGASFWLYENPFSFFRQMFLMPTGGGISLSDILYPSFFSKPIYLLSLFMLGFITTVYIIYFNPSDLFTKCALSLILMRLFCYHQIYDNIMIFMGVAVLGIKSLQSRKIAMMAIWLACTLAFAMPSSLLNNKIMPYFYNFVLVLTFTTILISPPGLCVRSNILNHAKL